MKQEQKKKRHCLNWKERLHIEALHKAGLKPKEIAEQLGFHFTTIYRELKKGRTIQRNSDWTEREIYSPDLGQSKYEDSLKKKGVKIKILGDVDFHQYIERMILEHKFSPAALLANAENENMEFKAKICLSTLYNYIRKGVFPNISLSDCPYRQTKKKKKKKKVQKKLSAGDSIEKRPDVVDERKTFGHWEMDTVIGKQGDKKSLLVLTERLSRYEIIFLLKRHTSAEVVKSLNQLERQFGEKNFRKIFRSITVDNGTEFSDTEGMQKSRRNKKNRTSIFYCHPYSSYERGSNENINRMIRRWFPKGHTMEEVQKSDVKYTQTWLNKYPRRILGYRSPLDVFQEEVRMVCMV